jgi:membrane-bound ClpP family serine protease
MEIAIVIVLLLVAVSLLLVEMFLIPGLSIAGIGGLLFLGGAVYYAYSSIGPEAGHLTLLGSFVMMTIAIIIFIRSKALERMSLKTEIDGKNDPMQGMELQVGDVGITSSRLAPMGKIRVNGHVVEARAIDDFIDQDVSVVIIKVQSTNVLVERITETK